MILEVENFSPHLNCICTLLLLFVACIFDHYRSISYMCAPRFEYKSLSYKVLHQIRGEEERSKIYQVHSTQYKHMQVFKYHSNGKSLLLHNQRNCSHLRLQGRIDVVISIMENEGCHLKQEQKKWIARLNTLAFHVLLTTQIVALQDGPSQGTSETYKRTSQYQGCHSRTLDKSVLEENSRWPHASFMRRTCWCTANGSK